ncbi:hypothetical protein [Algoriphagus sp. PAP.12]|jgi:hypothetical protein|uniref:hypothetical protein n=1 Tax=Algoriphagus sp. PAP.12 TaxID=2996678 RepID=UPI00227A5DA7|nr:hypothetical protein [Algoriphagus sp. PAP.12]
MGNTKNLEDFRLNKYLAPHLAWQKYGPDKAVEMSYSIYAIHAFYSTMEDIKDLEQQDTFVNNGRRSNVSIALWFLALESFINCICKIICLRQNQNFTKELSTKSIGKRLGFLFDILEVEGEAMRKSGLIARVNEFVRFRNEIFHDRNIGEEIHFHKTNFSPRPFFSNQVDVFQSLLIFIEVSYGLRFVINGLDLMANVSIGKSELLIFEKLDKLYNSFLKTFFKRVLEKHELTTSLNLNIEDYYQPVPYSNTFFEIGEVLPVFQRQQQSDFIHPLNKEKTAIGAGLYAGIIEASGKTNGHYDSMNFMLDWPKMYSKSKIS